MDEQGLRRTLNALASTPEPPPRFDLGRTMSAGRRNRRLRQAAFWGSALATGTAIAVVIVMVVAPRNAALPEVPSDQGPACPSLSTSAPTASPSLTPDPLGTGAALAVPPVPLSPLAPCVSFGWLPPGYTADTTASGNFSQSQPQYTELAASHGGSADSSVIQLFVNAADTCTQYTLVVNCGWLGQNGDIALSHPAPAVGGMPAYWASPCALLWQYEPGAWALIRNPCGSPQTILPSASMQSTLLREAAGVQFTSSAPMVFPYWLGGVPASWHVSLTQFAQTPAAQDGFTLWFGPSSAPSTFTLTVIPASDTAAVRDDIDQACPGTTGYGVWGNGTTVTVDGAQATYWTLNQPHNHDQRLCASDVDGYSIWADVEGSGTPQFRTVAALVKALHLLSTNAAAWTSKPLR